ncbi:MAG: LptF/LptG family permease [Planctomycetes bacterium]|nr:LptF/LptG family permease [Planctomycetota bacterium]
MNQENDPKIIGKNLGAKPTGLPLAPDDVPAIGATGFYYVTPTDAWGEAGLSGRRNYFRLIILPIYILKELLKGVILSAAVFSLILMAIFAGQVMRDGIGPYTLARILPNFLPLICPFVLPLAIITGIIICYSRLTSDNEILAAYAGGIHPFWLMSPAFLVSVIAIFITLTLNEVTMLPAIRNIERLVVDDQANILRRMIARPGSFTVQTGSEYIAMSKPDPSQDPTGRAPLDITRFNIARPNHAAANFSWNPRYPFPAKRVVARDHAVHDFSESSGKELTLKMLVTRPIFSDLHPSDINKNFIVDGEFGEERITLGGRPNVTIHANRTAFWPILMLSETRREAQNRISEMEASGKRIEELPAAQRAEMEDILRRLTRLIADRTATINMRLALCFSCLAFAILGIPLGMRTRSTLASAFAAGIITSGVYFLMLKSAEIQSSRGMFPFWFIWIPDALVVLLGLFLWVWNSRRG